MYKRLNLYRKLSDETAQSMTEYALIMAAVAVVAFAAYSALGTQIVNLVNSVSSSL